MEECDRNVTNEMNAPTVVREPQISKEKIMEDVKFFDFLVCFPYINF